MVYWSISDHQKRETGTGNQTPQDADGSRALIGQGQWGETLTLEVG